MFRPALLALFVALALNTASARPEVSCDCAGNYCHCCQKIDISIIKVHDEFCGNLTARAGGPNDIEVEVKIVENGNKVLYDKVLTDVKDEELDCEVIPLPLPISLLKPEVCASLGDVEATDKEVKGCLELEFKIKTGEIGSTKLGCFDLKVKGNNEVTMTQRVPHQVE